MKKALVVLALVFAFVLVGCMTTVKPFAATSNELGSKVGEASAKFLFGALPLSFNMDLGIQKAAQNGGITKISTVDVKAKQGFLVTTVSTVVTGE
jgi:hypothetical protein